jgi:hypothetical protein
LSFQEKEIVTDKRSLLLNLAIRLIAGTVFAAVARFIADWLIASWPNGERFIGGALGLSVALVFAVLIYPLIGRKQRLE